MHANNRSIETQLAASQTNGNPVLRHSEERKRREIPVLPVRARFSFGPVQDNPLLRNKISNLAVVDEGRFILS
jgi:hypothetical protein